MEKRLLSKEEKLAIINEAEQSGNITQVIRKYGIGYSLFYKWIHRYIAESINGLEPRNRSKSNSRIGIYSSKEIDMMQLENQRLKKIVAEKELQIEMLQELLKKKESWNIEDLVNLTLSYNIKGLSINKTLDTIMLAYVKDL